MYEANTPIIKVPFFIKWTTLHKMYTIMGSINLKMVKLITYQVMPEFIILMCIPVVQSIDRAMGGNVAYKIF